MASSTLVSRKKTMANPTQRGQALTRRSSRSRPAARPLRSVERWRERVVIVDPCKQVRCRSRADLTGCEPATTFGRWCPNATTARCARGRRETGPGAGARRLHAASFALAKSYDPDEAPDPAEWFHAAMARTRTWTATMAALALLAAAPAAAGASSSVDYGPISHKGFKTVGAASTSLKLSLQLGLDREPVGPAEARSSPRATRRRLPTASTRRCRRCRASTAPRRQSARGSSTRSSPTGSRRRSTSRTCA